MPEFTIDSRDPHDLLNGDMSFVGATQRATNR